MTRRLVVLASLLCATLALAQNVRQQQEANARYLRGVKAFADAMKALDEEAARSLFEEALEHFGASYLALVSDVHQSLLMQALTLKRLNRMDEALQLFESLLESPNEAVRERATTERTAIFEGLGEAEWAIVQLECGLSRVSVRVQPTAVIGENAVSAARLGKWVPCEQWAELSVLRPGEYDLYLNRKAPDGRSLSTQRKIELGIGARQKILVHFELAPSPPIYITDCNCNSGPDCRPVRVGEEALSATTVEAGDRFDEGLLHD